MILEAFTKPYCQMTALDGLFVAVVIYGIFMAIYVVFFRKGGE